MQDPAPPPGAQPWWGSYDLPQDAAARFKIGPLLVWVEHRVHEWRLAWERAEGEPPDDGVDVACPAPREEPPESAAVERIAGRQTSAILAVSPRLADRSIVSRPETRLRLAGGDEIELYVGTHLWARFETADPSRQLLELPILQPSDTWFGPSTLEGELCYASRTTARLQLENLPPKPYRALTQVRLENHGGDDVLLERLNLPVPHLSLYAAADGHLWTESVTVERGADGQLAEVRIGGGPPAEAGAAEAVAAPRLEAAGSVFSRALSALWG